MYSNDPFHNDDAIRNIYDKTEIRRKPITGIVSGYHVLPYILVGPDSQSSDISIKLKGEIRVSPKLIFSINPDGLKYEDVFDESKLEMSEDIVGRIFSFRSPKFNNMEIKGEQLFIEKHSMPHSQLLEDVLDELTQKEIINTGVIGCPQTKFYPVSLEKYIASILDKEF